MELDHIVTKRDGGSDDWNNLRATHASCNRRRGHELRWRAAVVPVPVVVQFRLPAELERALRPIAKRERRSINGQVLYMLERALAAEA